MAMNHYTQYVFSYFSPVQAHGGSNDDEVKLTAIDTHAKSII
jgi:hypothetical protein